MKRSQMNLDKIKNSRTHLLILKFFHENQQSVDTPRGIATWTGIDKKEVRKALDELAEMKLLVALEVPSTTGYSYTQDKNLIKKVAALLKNFQK